MRATDTDRIMVWVKRKRPVGVALAVTTAVVLVAGCANSTSSVGSGGEYKVGMLADLSTSIAQYDKPASDGLQAYVAALNKQGGVNGKKITVTVLDTKSDVPTTRTDFGNLVDQGVVTIMGPLLSTAYQAVEPLAMQSKVALMSAGAPPADVKPAQPYFFGTGISLPYEATIMVKRVSQLAGSGGTKPRIAALSTSSVSTAAWRDKLAADTQSVLGTTLVANLVLASTVIDPSTPVSQIIASKPDYVMLRILASQVPLTVRGLRDKGFTGQIISDYGGADTAVLKAVNDPKYLAIRQFEDPTSSSEAAAQKLLADAQAAGVSGSAASAFFTYGYVTGSVIAEVLTACGSTCSSEKFASTLAGSKSLKGVAGLHGPLRFGSGDHILVNYGRLYQWDPTKGAVPVSDWIDGSAA